MTNDPQQAPPNAPTTAPNAPETAISMGKFVMGLIGAGFISAAAGVGVSYGILSERINNTKTQAAKNTDRINTLIKDANTIGLKQQQQKKLNARLLCVEKTYLRKIWQRTRLNDSGEKDAIGDKCTP